MQMAAALSYYFVLSLFPALIFLSAVVAFLPVPDLFGQARGMVVRFALLESLPVCMVCPKTKARKKKLRYTTDDLNESQVLFCPIMVPISLKKAC